MTLRGTTPVVVGLALAACGGGDSNEPEDPFPAVAGTYQVDGRFDDVPPEEASFTGALEIIQLSQEDPAIEGSIDLSASIGDEVFTFTDEPLQQASVTTGGELTFTLGSGDATWSFTGDLAGTDFSGRHVLANGTDAFAGDWTAEQVSPSSRSAAGQRSPGSLAGLLRRLDAGAKR